MKIGMVLAGGGAKGAYEIGVWKALREFKIDKYINVISGTSIGALNAILFMQGDLEIAEELWCNISKETVLPTDNKDLIARGILVTLGSKNMKFVKKYIPKALEAGNISRDGLVNILDDYIDFNRVLNRNITCYASCTEIPDFVPKYFKINEYDLDTIKNILLATSALPMIYESQRVEGNQYLDGAMVDNIPIQPVYGEKCDIIIVVSLSNTLNINKRMYPNTRFIEIVPKVMDESFVDGTLGFTRDGAEKRIKQGYEDTIEYLNPIFELHNFINREEKNKIKYNNFFKFNNKNNVLDILKTKVFKKFNYNNNHEIR